MDTDFDNKLIDRFEDEIRAGESPEIERFLALCPEDTKQRVLFELISIEIFHRVKKGRAVSNSDYGRFGEVGENHAHRLREQFRTVNSPKMASVLRHKKDANPSRDG